ncbi:MAG: hypothetical protein HQK53_12130 [Oligoflexia bacterium]|nr:hypothetical protein [Oligoflexia bacterium]
MKKVLFSSLIVISSLIFANGSYAMETDNFMAWNKEIKDSVDIVNEIMNGNIEKSLTKINSGAPIEACWKVAFKVGLSFNQGVESKITGLLRKDSRVDLYPHLSQYKYWKSSIYRKIPLDIKVAKTLNLNGIHLGTDKIDHFVGIGYLYYLIFLKEMNYLSNKENQNEQDSVVKLANDLIKSSKYDEMKNLVAENVVSTAGPANSPANYSANTNEEKLTEIIKKLIRFGLFTERYPVGRQTLGILSFGDVEADFQGFNFYYRMCNGDDPYLKKDEVGDWYWTQPLDMREYVNPNLDETYNLSIINPNKMNKIVPYLKKYCSKRTDPKVVERMEQYKKIDNPSFSVEYVRELLRSDENAETSPYSFTGICRSLN